MTLAADAGVVRSFRPWCYGSSRLSRVTTRVSDPGPMRGVGVSVRHRVNRPGGELLTRSVRHRARPVHPSGSPAGHDRGMNSALIVIDVQESFRQRPSWPAVSDPEVISQVNRLVAAARRRGDLVVWVLHAEPGTGTLFDPARGYVRLIDGLAVSFRSRVHGCPHPSARVADRTVL